MTTHFSPGDRVRVRRDSLFGTGPWPGEPTGTVEYLSDVVEGPRGRIHLYLVAFDEPQTDAEGDGPYRGADIAHPFLEPIQLP